MTLTISAQEKCFNYAKLIKFLFGGRGNEQQIKTCHFVFTLEMYLRSELI